MYGKIVATIALSLMVAVPVLPAVAQDNTGVATDTVEDVVEETASDAGILPTNPFYFIREWGRGLRRAFIFNPIKRAEFELRVTDEKASELEEVSELEGEDGEGIDRAARNYGEAVARLRARLERVEENSENPNVQKLLGNLADRTAEHRELITRLRTRYEQFENLRSRLEQTGESVERAMDSVRGGVEAVEELRGRVRSGDAELRVELETKMREFRQGVESSGAFNRLGDLESELRSRIESRTDGLRERFELRERINGEETRLRFENRLDTDDDDEDEDNDDEEDEDNDLDEDEDDDANEVRAQTYGISGNFAGPQTTSLTVNPLEAEAGQMQSMSVRVSDPNPVTSVTVVVTLDNVSKATSANLSLFGGTNLNGIWKGSVPFPNDTQERNYTITVTAVSTTGVSSIVTTIR